MKKPTLLFLILAVIVLATSAKAERISEHLQFQRGAVNGVLIENNGARLAIYGWNKDEAKGVDQVLLPHSRRDLVWLAAPLVRAGAKAVAPARESYFLETPNKFWDEFTKTRFHDYGQQSTKILPQPLAVNQLVKDGDEIEWHGLKFRVVETAAYTRGSCQLHHGTRRKEDCVYGRSDLRRRQDLRFVQFSRCNL